MINHILSYNSISYTYTYSLSLHDALPIYLLSVTTRDTPQGLDSATFSTATVKEAVADVKIKKEEEITEASSSTARPGTVQIRSEEHTSELQSLTKLVCRLLLEKKKQQ